MRWPGHRRAEIDLRLTRTAKDRYVEWMDFSFYIGFSRDTAVRLHNIKYKGETIMYELGLVEALAHYAGNDRESLLLLGASP